MTYLNQGLNMKSQHKSTKISILKVTAGYSVGVGFQLLVIAPITWMWVVAQLIGLVIIITICFLLNRSGA